MNNKIALILVMVLSVTSAALAEQKEAHKHNQAARAKMQEASEYKNYKQRVDIASEVYQAVSKGSHGEVPSSVLKNARCIAVLPAVMTGAIIVGGTHGEGLVSCKNSNNVWSQPATIALNRASIGLQAGAKSTDLVLFFQSQEAETALKRGKLKFGADISAVAGDFDSRVDTSRAGVVAYTKTEGLFAGVSVSGGKITKDTMSLEECYGNGVDYVELLNGTVRPDNSDYSKKLIKLFPN